jgi:hypothetical protein
MKVSGRCLGGNISYRAELDPIQVTICHCSDCQMMSGSPYRVSVRVPKETFQMLCGNPKIYIKTAQSGAKRAHSFGPDCGTPVYSADLHELKTFSLRVGCLDKRAELPPARQIWCKSAMPWSVDLNGIPSAHQH